MVPENGFARVGFFFQGLMGVKDCCKKPETTDTLALLLLKIINHCDVLCN